MLNTYTVFCFSHQNSQTIFLVLNLFNYSINIHDTIHSIHQLLIDYTKITCHKKNEIILFNDCGGFYQETQGLCGLDVFRWLFAFKMLFAYHTWKTNATSRKVNFLNKVTRGVFKILPNIYNENVLRKQLMTFEKIYTLQMFDRILNMFSPPMRN